MTIMLLLQSIVASIGVLFSVYMLADAVGNHRYVRRVHLNGLYRILSTGTLVSAVGVAIWSCSIGLLTILIAATRRLPTAVPYVLNGRTGTILFASIIPMAIAAAGYITQHKARRYTHLHPRDHF